MTPPSPTARLPYYEALVQDIPLLYKTPEEIAEAERVVAEAEAQTRRRDIIRLRKPRRIRRIAVRWLVRLRYGFHLRKGTYNLRVARGYLLSFLEKAVRKNRPVFRGIEFGLTFRCNFKCRHCLCARIDETETRRELDPDEYERIVAEAMALGAHTFGLEGGEPFVCPDWEEIIGRMRPWKNHIIISTNGYMLDEGLVRRCAAAGVDTLNISLDSGIPQLHDLFRRKKGSFDRVLRAVELCRAHGIKVILNTVVHKSNLHTEGLIRLFEFAERRKVLINVLFAKGVGAFKDKEEMMSEADYAAFFAIAAPYTYWHIHHWGKLKSNHGGEGCSGVKEFINMTPYGDVICCANNHVYLGNVREEPLAAIRERALRESPFGRYRRCFLTRDPDFMNVYYPLLEERGWVSLEEFRKALRAYEDEKRTVVYPELKADG
ncbi:MAG: radical SAM protein [Candidatus Aminicenantes bacterium]|nr:radical SAM protein [Candidatus Aminicenantes bacterium]